MLYSLDEPPAKYQTSLSRHNRESFTVKDLSAIYMSSGTVIIIIIFYL